MAIKHAALCALLFAAGSVDARGGRGGRGGKGAASFNKFTDVASNDRQQFFGGSVGRGGGRGKQGGRGGRSEEPGAMSRPVKGDRGKGDRGKGGKGDRGKGGRGKGGKRGKGKGGKRGVEVLEKIEACEKDILLTCSLDFDFELDELKGTLEKLAAAKEEHKMEKQAEREEKHASLVKACPDLVKECGLPVELPTHEEGERPDREAMKEMKKAGKCVFSTLPDEVEEPCASFLSDMQAEREAAKAEKEEARENGEKPEHPGKPDEETIERLKAVRTCLQEDVKPNLEDDSVCLAALSRPDKPVDPVDPVDPPIGIVKPDPDDSVNPPIRPVDSNDQEDLEMAK